MAVKCTKNHLYDYLDHLTDAVVFFRVPLHTRSEKARTINPPKIYTIDTGLANAMTFRHAFDHGPLLETIVGLHLRRRVSELEYVAKKDGHETDFLARHPTTGEVHLVQVCWDMSERKTAERERRGLKSAMAALGIRSGTIVTWDDEPSLDGAIEVTAAWKWLLT
jgi:predicted AAA+ superfamily ATPase